MFDHPLSRIFLQEFNLNLYTNVLTNHVYLVRVTWETS